MTEDEIKVKYPHFDDKLQKWYKEAKKSPAEQLEDPINLASPTQLAILFYDIFKIHCIPPNSN